MNAPLSAATDVTEFIEDLDAGNFASLLSIAISDVVKGVDDSEKKKGSINVNFEIEKIPGTGQMRVNHTIKFQRPTLDGKKIEEVTRSTAMHVGRFGKLSLMPENQTKMVERDGSIAPAATRS